MNKSRRRDGQLNNSTLSRRQLYQTTVIMRSADERDPLTLLPFEPASEVLSSESLDTATPVRGRRVSKSWKKLCDNDEIWHKAAYRWGYAPNLSCTVQDVVRTKMDENRYFAQVQSWRDLCVAQEALNGELGDDRLGTRLQYPMSYYFHAAQSEETHGIWQDLWRMTIIHEDGLIVSTGMGGGIRVSDLRTHELLWSIPPEMTKPRPKLEADQEDLIWYADGNSAQLFTRVQLTNHALCTGAREARSIFTVYRSERFFSNSPYKSLRGLYRPWKVLKHPGSATRAFRFKDGQLVQ